VASRHHKPEVGDLRKVEEKLKLPDLSNQNPLSLSFILATVFFVAAEGTKDLICCLVIRVPGYRSRGPTSITGATRFAEK
jgi:hypothetical protein